MLEAKHLKKVYKPKRGVPVYALNDVSLKLPETGMVFILGKSGSGKSTLLNVLGGLDRCDSGEIIIKGESSAKFKQKHFDSYRNTYIGFIFQEYNILDEFSIGQNIALAIELQGRKATSEEINDILNKVDLAGMGNRKPNELSGGQKQRVAIARALVKNPQIIMADEPTGALDSKTGKQVFDTLKKLSKEKLVLIVSHDREFSEQYADRIIELADGKIISDVELEKKDDEAIEQKGLNFKENEIEVPEDYELTDADMKAINDYLKKRRDGHKVRLGIVAHGKAIGGGDFIPTDESKIPDANPGDFKLIKSRLPLKNAFKMGANSLGHKKGRLIFTIILSIVAFSLFGLASTLSNYNHVNTTTSSLMDSNVRYLALEKGVNEHPDDSYTYFNTYNQTFTDKEMKKLSDDMGVKFTGMLNVSGEFGQIANRNKNIKNGEATNITSVVTFDKDTLEKDFAYKVEGRMPNSESEIAISKFIFELYQKCGYTPMHSDETVKISAPNDLLGKTLSLQVEGYNSSSSSSKEYTIVGIVDTNLDTERYKNLIFTKTDNRNDGNGIVDMIYSWEFEKIVNYSMSNSLFVSEHEFARIRSTINTDVRYSELFYVYGSYEPNNGSLSFNFNSYNNVISFSTLTSEQYYKKDGSNTLAENELLINADNVINWLNNAKGSMSNEEKGYTEAQIRKILNSLKITDAGALTDDEKSNLVQRYVGGENERLDEAVAAYNTEIDNELIRLDNESEKENMIREWNDGCSYNNHNTSYFDYLYSTKYSYGSKNGGNIAFIKEIYTDPNMSAYKNKIDNMLDNITWDARKYSMNEQLTFTVAGYYQPEVDPDKGYSSDGVVFADSFLGSFTAKERGAYKSIIAPMPESESAVKKIVEYTQTTYENNTVKYTVANDVTVILDMVKDVLDNIGKVFLYIGIGFAVFASLMMFNFISTSVNFKRREIGILRAIGARSNDVFKIFFCESFIIAMINFAFSTLITGGVTIYLNSFLRGEYQLKITLLHFGAAQVGILFAIAIGVAAIASFFPVKKIAAQKPIDAIREK